MTDVAAGSTAARQMQQNVYGAQYDQANIAADAQKKQLDLQKEQAQIQEAEANTAQTKLNTILTKSKFERSEDAVVKMQNLAGTEEFKKATDGDKARLTASLLGSLGQPEAMEKSLRNGESLDLAELNKQIKTSDANSRQIQNAISVFGQVADDKVKEAIDGLPPEARDSVIKSLGKANYDKMDGKQIKAATHELMFSAKDKLGEMKIQAQINIAAERDRRIEASDRRRHDEVLAKIALGTNRSDSAQDQKKLKDSYIETSRAKADFRKDNIALDKEIEAATKAADKAAPFWESAREKTKERAAQEALLDKKESLQKNHLKKLVSIAKQGGNQDDIDSAQELYDESFPPETQIKPTPLPTETSSAKPTAVASASSGAGKAGTAPSAPPKAPASAGAALTAPAVVTSTKSSNDGSSAAKSLSMPSTQRDLEKGKFYQTARGPARWTGTGFSTDEETKPAATPIEIQAPRKQDTALLAEAAGVNKKKLEDTIKAEAEAKLKEQRKKEDENKPWNWRYLEGEKAKKEKEKAEEKAEKADKEKADKQWKEQQEAITESKKKGPTGYSSNDVDPLTGLIRQKTFTQYSNAYLEKIASGADSPGMITKEEAKAELKRRAAVNRLK
jgi:hypothetical protein